MTKLPSLAKLLGKEGPIRALPINGSAWPRIQKSRQAAAINIPKEFAS